MTADRDPAGAAAGGPGAGGPGVGNPGVGDPGFADLGHALADTGREARLGLPEVIYGPGKTVEQIAEVIDALLVANSGPVLVTRLDPATAGALAGPRRGHRSWHDAPGRLLCLRPAAPRGVRVAVVTAGTADAPVADEAAAVATAVGLTVDRIRDVGVAGIHRLLAQRDRLSAADVVVCVAGMEGALPSVVAGLVGAPVVAVPTSTGYGAALDGVTALLAMLSSCAVGVTVVNIDSGFGAAMAAFRLATRLDVVPAARSDPDPTADPTAGTTAGTTADRTGGAR